MIMFDIVHARQPQHTAQFLRRHLHRPWRRRTARRRLWESCAASRMKSNIAFYFLDRLMDMAVQYRDGPKTFQEPQRLLAVLRPPTPLRIDRPQRDMREHDDRRAGRKPLQVIL